MSSTIFQNIPKFYRLKVPNRKLLTPQMLEKAQTLAIAFYKFFFLNHVKIDICQTTLFSHNGPIKESIREAYTNMFYFLPMISQNLLDFISCLICLLGDDFFSREILQLNKQAEQFLEDLEKKQLKLREYLFIMYTFETIGCKVGKESAQVIFERYILTEIHANSNFGTKIRLNMQLKSIKEFLREKGDLTPRHKRKIRLNNTKSYQDEISDIMDANKVEIEEENKSNKKFQKFINRCITEGSIDFDASLSPKPTTETTKFTSFLKTIKNCQIFMPKSKHKKQKKSQNSRNYDYWQSILREMKNKAEICNKQVVSSLSPEHSVSISYKNEDVHIPFKKKFTAQKVQQTQQQSACELSNKKILIKYNKMLPDIKQYKEHIIMEEKKPVQNLKEAACNSRKLRKKLSQFLEERKSRVY